MIKRWDSRWLWGLLLITLSGNVAADSVGFSFSPTPGDVSVIFLSNIFGVVDGVLSGVGSQIVGEMFSIFNAAVLAIGGIILLYTLIITTVNTAHEGQMLGKKWSSVYTPLRSLIGIGMCIPKASGYCLMQIFIMNVVIQGIGAADAVWSAALGYMNQGGAIVLRDTGAVKNTNSAANAKTVNAAMAMLASQVCMKGIENRLSDWRLQLKNNTDICKSPIQSPFEDICKKPVPDFLDTVNLARPKTATYTDADGNSSQYMYADLPSIPTGTQYHDFDAVCGKVFWRPVQLSAGVNQLGLSRSETQSAQETRNVAMHQLFQALMPTAVAIVGNDSDFNSDVKCDEFNACALRPALNVSNNTKSYLGKYNFGMPLTSSFTNNCIFGTTNDDFKCYQWGTEQEDTVILRGTELQDAVAAYNGIMAPVLRLNSNYSSGSSRAVANYYRMFIRDAENKGWLMSGSYFFRIALLTSFYQQQNESNPNAAVNDADSGIFLSTSQNSWQPNQDSRFALIDVQAKVVCTDETWRSATDMTKYCFANDNPAGAGRVILNGLTGWSSMVALMSGKSWVSSSDSGIAPNQEDHGPMGDTANPSANTVYGFLMNANALTTPGQTRNVLNAGFKNDKSRTTFHYKDNIPQLSNTHMSGGKYNIPGKAIELLYNGVVKPLWNMIIQLVFPFVMEAWSAMITPIFGMVSNLFNEALEVMRVQGWNPIIVLANMGTRMIDGAGNAWITMIPILTVASFFPAGIGLILMGAPLAMLWIGVMLVVGFTSAYYVPFVPFIVFAFAAMGWFIGVIEAMVAAPIVALGLTLPDNHDLFGKVDKSIMLILSMFLRPALMVMGFIIGIIMSYVGIWLVNTGFNMTVYDYTHMTPVNNPGTGSIFGSSSAPGTVKIEGSVDNRASSESEIYGFWSKLMLYFFNMVIYMAIYVAIVNKSFEMIHHLPDQVMRWVQGGMADSLGGQSAAKGAREIQKGAQKAAGQASGAMAKVSGNLAKAGMSIASSLAPKGKGKDDGKTDENKGDDSKGGAAEGGGAEAPPP